MPVSIVSRVVPPTDIQDCAIYNYHRFLAVTFFLSLQLKRPKVNGTLAKVHTACVNYDPTCAHNRGYVFIGNASLSVMCDIFALLHKLSWCSMVFNPLVPEFSFKF
jgi:hypothetical protein